MFNKVLIANRGDQPQVCGAAAQSNRMMAVGHAGGFATGVHHV
jgi:hypothetical protein